jgi:hypothetical protein
VRVGLLGCGGRGTEDATLDAARANFDKVQQAKGYAAIDASQLFLGPNSYQQLAHSKER